jgi:hypothetical protein
MFEMDCFLFPHWRACMSRTDVDTFPEVTVMMFDFVVVTVAIVDAFWTKDLLDCGGLRADLVDSLAIKAGFVQQQCLA